MDPSAQYGATPQYDFTQTQFSQNAQRSGYAEAQKSLAARSLRCANRRADQSLTKSIVNADATLLPAEYIYADAAGRMMAA